MKIKNFLIKDSSDYPLLFEKINFLKNNKIIIFLKGELGSGKTTFVQKYLSYQYKYKNASSPTFGIINTYKINDLRYIIMIYTGSKNLTNFTILASMIIWILTLFI